MTDGFGAWLDGVRATFEAARTAAATPPTKDQGPRKADRRLLGLLPMQFEHRGRLRWARRAFRVMTWSAIAELVVYVSGLLGFVFVLANAWIPAFLWIALGVTFAVAFVSRTILGRAERGAKQWLAEAEVVPGALVYANDVLHRAGPEPAANAGFVITFDERLAADPERLLAIAERCFALHRPETKGTRAEAELQRRSRGWSEDRDEANPHTFDRVQVPRELCSNDSTFMVAVTIARDELPDGVIDRQLHALLARRDRNESAQLVPPSLWPDDGAA